MSEHTQGKLHLCTVYADDELRTEDGVLAAVVPSYNCAAYSRRLAAAWNACQGIPTEVLEAQQSGGLPWSVADQIEARVVHGVMLDALRLAIGPLAAIPGCAAEYDAVDAAIARATGGKA